MTTASFFAYPNYLDTDSIETASAQYARDQQLEDYLTNLTVYSQNINDAIQSDNYVAGVSGWRIERDTGNVEFGSGTFRGTITGSTLYIPDSTTYPRLLLGPSSLAVAGNLGMSLKNASSDNSAAEIGGTTGDISLYSGHVASGGAFTHVRAQASQVDVLANNGDSTVVTRVRVTPGNIQLVDSSFATVSLYGLLSGWTSYTPTLTQSGTVTFTNTRTRYLRLGSLVIFEFYLAVTGTGTAANNVTISLPVNAAANPGGGALPVGSGVLIDSSASATHKGTVNLVSTSAIGLMAAYTTATAYMGSDGFTAALASGDLIAGTAIYEV